MAETCDTKPHMFFGDHGKFLKRTTVRSTLTKQFSSDISVTFGIFSEANFLIYRQAKLAALRTARPTFA